jgi:hypothetical protein
MERAGAGAGEVQRHVAQSTARSSVPGGTTIVTSVVLVAKTAHQSIRTSVAPHGTEYRGGLDSEEDGVSSLLAGDTITSSW